jgi:putative transcriptional regulator
MTTTKKHTPTNAARTPRKFSSAFAEELIVGLEDTLQKIKTGGLASVKHTVLEIPADLLHPSDIRALRETLGLSQPLFAEFIGTSASTVRSWERGAKNPTPMAKRFLTAMRSDLGYWKRKLLEVTRSRTV